MVPNPLTELVSPYRLGRSPTERVPEFPCTTPSRSSPFATTPILITSSPWPRPPRPPIWIGGDSPAALRRAAHWDGWAAAGTDEHSGQTKTPERLAEQLAFIRKHRTSDAPFDVTMDGCTTPVDGARAREFADAGAAWWLEPLYGLRGSMEEMLARVKAGPPA